MSNAYESSRFIREAEEVSTRLGAYEVLGEIGRGGMGIVFRGRAPDGRVVAIKLLRKLDSPDARARFEREERILASLGEREGFVPLLDFGDAASSSSPGGRLHAGPFFVMPFLLSHVEQSPVSDASETDDCVSDQELVALRRRLQRTETGIHKKLQSKTSGRGCAVLVARQADRVTRLI